MRDKGCVVVLSCMVGGCGVCVCVGCGLLCCAVGGRGRRMQEEAESSQLAAAGLLLRMTTAPSQPNEGLTRQATRPGTQVR